MTETCYEAFRRGLDDRKAYDLSSGARRLRESLDGLQRTSGTLRNIAANIKFKVRGHGRLLGACTSDDAAEWLRSVPAQRAYNLGHNVVPAIKALARDGVPADAVSRCLASASSVIPAILDDCEAARSNLSHGIRAEYTRMKAGQSTVQPLVNAEGALISATLTAVKPWI